MPADDFDPSEPLSNPKNELFCQNRAMGNTWKDSYDGAGFNSKDPKSDAKRLLARSAQVRARLQYLKKERWEVGLRESRKLITRDWLIDELKENIEEAKTSKAVKVGDEIVWTRDAAAINASLKLAADVGGHIIRRTETRDVTDDPLEGASDEKIIELITSGLDELGVDSLKQLGFEDDVEIRGITERGRPAVLIGDGSGDREIEDAETRVLQAVPEADRTPLGGEELADSAADGRQPAREDGEWIG